MKTVDFSESIEACDLKSGRYRQLQLLSCFFLVFIRQNMLKILMFIYLFIFVVSISDYGIFIDRLSMIKNIVSFSDRRIWHVPLNL